MKVCASVASGVAVRDTAGEDDPETEGVIESVTNTTVAKEELEGDDDKVLVPERWAVRVKRSEGVANELPVTAPERDPDREGAVLTEILPENLPDVVV